MRAGIRVVSENETDGRVWYEQLRAGGFQPEWVADFAQALPHLARRDLGLCPSHARNAPGLPDKMRERLAALPEAGCSRLDTLHKTIVQRARQTQDFYAVNGK